jgi:diguanylate cyclase (GGDEF)-like protein
LHDGNHRNTKTTQGAFMNTFDLNTLLLAAAALFAFGVGGLVVARFMRKRPAKAAAPRACPAMPTATKLDPLTQVYSREALDEVLQAQLCMTARARQPLSLLLVDVDNFAGMWRKSGRDEMDKTLLHIAKALARTVRAGDLVCRYGGATFAVVLPGADAKEATLLGERIRAEIPRTCRNVVMKGERVSVTVGVAASPIAGTSPAAIFQLAVDRLNDGRRAGKDRVVAGSEGHMETLCIRVAS